MKTTLEFNESESRISSLSDLPRKRCNGFHLTKIFVFAVSVFIGLIALPSISVACLRPTGSNDADYKALAAAFADSTLWLRVDFGGNRHLYATAVRLDAYHVLTAGHAVYSTSFPTNDALTVGRGNFLTAPVDVTSADPVVDLVPGFTGNLSMPDLAIVTLLSPLSGEDLTFGSAAANEIVFSSGVSRSGTPSTGLAFQDGNFRAFEARISSALPGSANNYFFNSTTFGYNNSGVSLNGRATEGSSGAPVYNNAGQLIGITSATIGATIGATGQTIYVDLTVPEVKAWIQSYLVATPGDANRDGSVNFDDLLILAQNYGTTAGMVWSTGDFTNDGAVGFDDLLILAQNYNTGPNLANSGKTTATFSSDWTRARSTAADYAKRKVNTPQRIERKKSHKVTNFIGRSLRQG